MDLWFFKAPLKLFKYGEPKPEKWQLAFPNITDWSDERKKETYLRYVKELMDADWMKYSSYPNTCPYCHNKLKRNEL